MAWGQNNTTPHKKTRTGRSENTATSAKIQTETHVMMTVLASEKMDAPNQSLG
jgi:hypothetical protein